MSFLSACLLAWFGSFSKQMLTLNVRVSSSSLGEGREVVWLVGFFGCVVGFFFCSHKNFKEA